VNRRWRPPGAAYEGTKAGWLTTFNDLMTLLLVFFVMLFAMSSTDGERMRRLQAALQGGQGLLEGGTGISGEPGPPGPRPAAPAEGGEPAIDPAALLGLAAAAGIAADLGDGGEVRLRLDNQVLFPFGRAEILPAGLEAIGRLGRLLAPLPVEIQVEGHTDNLPIRTERYPSNWELSTARAVTVLKALAEGGQVDPRRLSAVGYGASRPLGPNGSEAQRAANRRVQIIVSIEKGR
jgi:chemotaxis protein MotB